jgi:hypothetical protein
MRFAVKSKVKVLDRTSPSELRTLFEGDQSNSAVSTGSTIASNGNQSVGGERSSRSSRPREDSSNNRREDETAGTSLAAENDDDGDNESYDTASAAAAAHLREAAIVQMAELGLPRQWAELALSRVGGNNIEAAVHFCLERGGDMENLLTDETQRRGHSTFVSDRRRGFGASRMNSSNLIRQLVEMGFPQHWCIEALSATRNNVDEALTWILMNGDRLTVDDEAVEDGHDEETGDDGDDSEEEEEEEEEEEGDVKSQGDNENDEENDRTAEYIQNSVINQPASFLENSGWSEICPVRCVSGRPDINPHTLEVIGSPNVESSSVGTKGVLLMAGKWYYEVEVKTAGCIYIGWADSSLTGHSVNDQSESCGNGPHTWTYDGWRRHRWHANATGPHPHFYSIYFYFSVLISRERRVSGIFSYVSDWGCKWNKGDIVGCLVDMESMSVSFTLNGKGEEIGMGIAFSIEGFCPSSGVFAYVCLNRYVNLLCISGVQFAAISSLILMLLIVEKR